MNPPIYPLYNEEETVADENLDLPRTFHTDAFLHRVALAWHKVKTKDGKLP